MKKYTRITALVLLALIVVATLTTACAATAQQVNKPQVTSPPKITVKPTPKSTPILIATPQPTQNTVMAMKPRKSDWKKINPDFPKYLYEFEYCKKSLAEINSTTVKKFSNNMNIVKLWDTNFRKTKSPKYDLDLYVKTAIDSYSASYTANYQNTNDFYTKYMYYMSPLDNGKTIAADWVKTIKDNELEMESHLVTDRSLVYRDTDGLVRVRGLAFLKITHSSQKILNEWGCKLNDWNVCVGEYSFVFADKKGWKYSKFVICGVKEFEPHVATTDELELLKKYGGVKL